jgi:hypothetical protein
MYRSFFPDRMPLAPRADLWDEWIRAEQSSAAKLNRSTSGTRKCGERAGSLPPSSGARADTAVAGAAASGAIRSLAPTPCAGGKEASEYVTEAAAARFAFHSWKESKSSSASGSAGASPGTGGSGRKQHTGFSRGLGTVTERALKASWGVVGAAFTRWRTARKVGRRRCMARHGASACRRYECIRLSLPIAISIASAAVVAQRSRRWNIDFRDGQGQGGLSTEAQLERRGCRTLAAQPHTRSVSSQSRSDVSSAPFCSWPSTLTTTYF